MFNVTVLKMKDIIKYIIGIFILILLIVSITMNINKSDKNTKSENKIANTIEKGIMGLSNNNFLSCLNKTIPVVGNVNENENVTEGKSKESENMDLFNGILEGQISSINVINSPNEQNEVEVAKEETNNLNETSKNEQEVTQPTDDVPVGVPTQVITNNPITESYNVEYGKVKIKNQTDYQLTEEMLKPDITIENKNILLFHTHSCESYTSSEAYPYTPTGNFRTTDLNFTVTRVGTELETYLKKYNYNVVHSTDYHDYPSYNGSYTKSLQTVETLLQTTPSDIIIDLHRDAIGSRSDYAPIVKIGETDVAAQLMFVIGTNNGGLWHPNWNQNLKFAIKVQEKAEEMYPGLFKPIMLTTSRYNQHTGKYASIIEVGATGNTLEQCLTSMKYLAKIMDEIMK